MSSLLLKFTVRDRKQNIVPGEIDQYPGVEFMAFQRGNFKEAVVCF